MILKKILKIILKTSKYLLLIIILLLLIGFIFTKIAPVFGGNPDLIKLEKSKNFKDGRFINLINTTLKFRTKEELKEDEKFKFSSFFFPPKDKNPETLLPSEKFEKDTLDNDTFSWFGHSTILMKLNDKVIILDPVFNNASPVPFTGKAFGTTNIVELSLLPNIDIVLITHDHYDHLDYKTIKDLGNNVGTYIVPLGVKSHLIKWGIDENKIQEMDWYDKTSISNIDFTFTPSRHFSGRNLDNRNSTLWGGFIINNKSKNIYVSGDGGYFDEFKKIGENYGPFDIAFIENGAYNKAWAQIHMFPEQAVQAGLDLNAKILLPIHWAKFDLSSHKWDEPINRFIKEAENKNIKVATPLIGEIFSTNNFSSNKWWLDF